LQAKRKEPLLNVNGKRKQAFCAIGGLARLRAHAKQPALHWTLDR
jgi:hypothetical protein